jgi:hypothetical protein
MPIEMLNDVDFNQNHAQQLALENLAVAPLTPVEGQEYFDTALGYARIWDGAAWQGLGAAGSMFAATIGDGLALTYTITHNLGTRDVNVTVYQTAAPFQEQLAVIQHTTINTVTAIFSVPPVLNSLRVVVIT